MAETKLLTIAELAKHVDGRLIGDGSIHIQNVAGLSSAGTGEIAYVEDEKFFEAGKSSQASCLIVPPEFVSALKQSIVENEFKPALIEVANPKLAFALIAGLLHPIKRREPFVHPSAVISPSAEIDLTVFIGPHVSIGEGTRIEAGVVIEDHVRVGRDCVLHPAVTLYDDLTIGDRVVLHAGVVIGADGFGY